MKTQLFFLIVLNVAILNVKGQTDMKSMFIENESKYAFDETIEKITELVIINDWRITIVHDLQKTLSNNEIDVLPVKVMEICNPELSGKILAKDSERIVSSLMPCRIAVYEKSNGKTYVSRMNAELFANEEGGMAEQVMLQAFNETEEIIKPILQ